MPTNVTNAAESNVIKAAQMSKVREVDFVSRFTHGSLAKLLEVLGVTRKLPMQEGTTMYMYTTTGTLQSGAVPEGAGCPITSGNEKSLSDRCRAGITIEISERMLK